MANTKTKLPTKCELCDKKAKLVKATIRVFSHGWETQTVYTCKKCIEVENTTIINSKKKAA